MDEIAAIDRLGSLAQPTRLAALRRLLAAHPGSLAAGELARACEVAPQHHVDPSRRADPRRPRSRRARRPHDELSRRREGVPWTGDLPDERLLQRPARAVRRHRPAHSQGRRPINGAVHGAGLQCPVPVHAQFGALDHRRGAARKNRQGPVQRLLGGVGAGTRADAGSHRPAEASRPRRIEAALQVVERIHRPQRAAHGFRHRPLRHAAGPGLPRPRREVRQCGVAPARSRGFHGLADRTGDAAQRALRHGAPPAGDLHQPALPVARPHGAEEAARRDRRHRAHRAVRETAHARRHQRHGPHGTACTARGDGRRAPCRRRSARRQPARCRASQRGQGRRGGDRAPARVRQHRTAAGTPPSASRTTRAIRDRQQVVRLQRRGASRATSPGAISAATSCWNAPASS